jgi:hypothetical protein
MKLTENQKNRLIEVIAKKHGVSESFVGQLFKYINAKKLARDPEIQAIARNLDKVTQDVRDTFDKKIKSGELRDTPELRKLRKDYGL